MSARIDDYHKFYLAGPMRGLPDDNYPTFNTFASCHRVAFGREVVNPAELHTDRNLPLEAYLAIDIREMLKCEAVLLLPGWQDSRGALREVLVALIVGMPLFCARLGEDRLIEVKQGWVAARIAQLELAHIRRVPA